MLFRPEDSQCLSPRQQGSKGVGQQQPIDLAHILFLLVTSTGGTEQQPIQMKCLNSSLWRVLACVDKPVDAKIDRAHDLDTQTSKNCPFSRPCRSHKTGYSGETILVLHKPSHHELQSVLLSSYKTVEAEATGCSAAKLTLKSSSLMLSSVIFFRRAFLRVSSSASHVSFTLVCCNAAVVKSGGA